MAQGQHAFFVGNANSVWIEGNHMAAPDRPQGERTFEEGVRVYGRLGPLLTVRENLLGNAAVGVLVQPLEEQTPHAWRVVGNVAPAARFGVVAPASVVRTDNEPSP
ncbi:MAG: hypothetical protein ACRDU8_05140 [Egibacteraceae bacterium]